MSRTTFAELAASLPHPQALPTIGSSYPGLDQPALEEPHFVEPEFEDTSEQIVRSPSVLLISAPAAVGKTWLCRALSSRTGNPMWELGRFNLGHNFFSGTLARAYGPEGYADLAGKLEEASVALLLDAADEAAVRVGSDSFQAAMEDLCALIPKSSLTPAAVILGRPDTIDTAILVLLDHGLSYREMKVDYFGTESRERFVLEKVGANSETEQAYVRDFLHDFFRSVRLALPPDDYDRFVGYAPVLDTLALFCKKSTNPFAALQKLRGTAPKLQVWSIMTSILTLIMKRETDKLIDTLHPENDQIEAVLNECYSPPRQIEFLRNGSTQALTVSLPSSVSADWKGRIEHAVAEQFRVHPFLAIGRSISGRVDADWHENFASIVFRDYIAAYSSLNGTYEVAAEVAARMAQPSYSPSAIFARFLAQISNKPSNVAQLQDATFRHLVASVHEDNSEDSVCISVYPDDDDAANDDVLATLRVLLIARRDILADWRLEVAESLDLGAVISNTQIEFDGIVSSPLGHDFLIGPNTQIYCRTFLCDSTSVLLRSTPSAPAVIECEKLVSRTSRIAQLGRSVFSVSCDSALNYPWHDYADAAQGTSGTQVASGAAANQLRRIQSWFSRRSQVGSCNYPVRAMDAILSKGRAPVALFQYLLEVGLIVREDKLYHFERPAPAHVIKVADRNDEQLAAFLQDYAIWLANKTTSGN